MANTFTEARDELSAFVLAAWNTATSSAPLEYDNLDSQRPKTPALWGRLHIRKFQGTRASLGSGHRFRRPGRVFVQIFAPVGTGMESLDQVSNALVEAFEDAGAIGNIWFRDAGAREVGMDSEYSQVNVEVDFTFDRVT
jgi:hypothetical protein